MTGATQFRTTALNTLVSLQAKLAQIRTALRLLKKPGAIDPAELRQAPGIIRGALFHHPEITDEVVATLEAVEMQIARPAPITPPLTPAEISNRVMVKGGALDASGEKTYLVDPAEMPHGGQAIPGGYFLGAGNVAEVYRATDLDSGETVALKILTNADPHTRAEKRFRIEAHTGRLVHPHIVRFYASGFTVDRQPFITMQYLPFPDLEKVIINKTKLSPETVVRWTIQILQAMQKAHDESIFHRDLKPSNIFHAQRQGVDYMVISDFGNAKVLDNNLSTSLQNVTQMGEFSGTPDYMAPEILTLFNLQTGRAMDLMTLEDWLARVDIYAIGCVMYELFALKASIRMSETNITQDLLAFCYPLAYPNDVEDVKMGRKSADQLLDEKIAGHTLQSRFEVEPLNDLDPALWQIIEKMIARDPRERYQTTTDALNALFKYYRANYLFGR